MTASVEQIRARKRLECWEQRTGSFQEIEANSRRSYQLGDYSFAPKCSHYKRRLAPSMSGHCISHIDMAVLSDEAAVRSGRWIFNYFAQMHRGGRLRLRLIGMEIMCRKHLLSSKTVRIAMLHSS